MTTSRKVAVVRAGFIPLIDSAAILTASVQGFAAAEGVELQLVPETSWANIRDKIAVGHLDVAHMLAPMPIASNLGLNPLATELIAPMALGTGGNTITLSRALWAELQKHGVAEPGEPAAVAGALGNVIEHRRSIAARRLTFGIVHPHSSHHYELAYVLGFAGVRPDVDVRLAVVPPQLMPDALEAGQIDGFSAGEPWGTISAMRGIGTVALTKSAIWRSSPEKVLGMKRDWARANSDVVARLIRALYRAAEWCDAQENREELVALLAHPEHLNVAADEIKASFEGKFAPVMPGSSKSKAIFTFAAGAASFPWQSHALWFYSQMVRWGQTAFRPEDLDIVRQTFRPDIYRSALAPLGVTLPGANAKIEGSLTSAMPVGATKGVLLLGPDGFFDGRTFDPDHVLDYLAGFNVATRSN